MVTIKASGKMSSIQRYAGIQRYSGRSIAKWDFVTYPCRCIYECQTSEWMDMVIKLQW